MGLRSAFPEGKHGWRHRDGYLPADRASGMEVLEFEQQWRSNLLPLRNNHGIVGGADFLLDDHADCKILDPAFSYFALFCVRVQRDEGLEKLRTEAFVLAGERVYRLSSRCPFVNEPFIS